MAGYIDGTTPDDERSRILRKFKDGEIQLLVNVGIATEGFDSPDCEVIVMGRPTKSRALYTQMCGRGTRPLAGILEGLNSAFERKEAIATSSKPSCLILDFAGNSGKHKLMTTADILGGSYDDETKDRALKKSQSAKGPVRMADLLAESQKEIRERKERRRLAEEARKARLIAKVQFTSKSINPFDAFDIKPVADRGWDRGRKLTEKQSQMLLKLGVNPDETTFAAGVQLLNEQIRRWKNGLCTAKQAALLKKHGYDTSALNISEASRLSSEMKNNHWQRPI